MLAYGRGRWAVSQKRIIMSPRLAHFAKKTKKPLREDFKTLEIRSNCAVLIH